MIDGNLRPYPTPPVVVVRLTYTALDRTKELRNLCRNIENQLKHLENETDACKEIIHQEKIVLEAVYEEIRQRERMAFLSEFGSQ